MKKIFLPFLLFICLFLNFGSLALGQIDDTGSVPTGEAQSVPPALKEPPFKLENMAGDSKETLQLKAALRLYKGYQLTVMRLRPCLAQNTGAKKAIDTYVRLNGNTMRLVLSSINQFGGFSPERKEVLDGQMADELAQNPVNCQKLIEEVENGAHDIYKAPQFIDDYKFIRAK